ncbi:MAG TPA: hypothetical protein VM282_22650 [Acidimicrobiales bacterium]|nr:hypothetical protein [Acidimicrobiales bacterium]
MFVPEVAQRLRRQHRRKWRGRALELFQDVERGTVDPVAAQPRRQHVTRRLAGLDGDVGGVVVASAGHRDVNRAGIDRPVDQREGPGDGAALRAVRGLRIAQLDIGGDVLGRQPEASVRSGHSDRAVAVQPLDDPVVAVVHWMTAVGGQVPVVAPGDDLVTDMEPIPTRLERAFRVELTAAQAHVLGGAVEGEDGVVGGCGPSSAQRARVRLRR